MKKFLFIIVFIGIQLSAVGQSWSTTEHKSDAMKKTKAYTSYKFEDASGNQFIYWTWSEKDGDFRIITNQDIFNYGERRFIAVNIGFYDNQDNLLDKSTITLKVEEDPQFARVPYKKKTAVKTIKYLNENEGYVRIIAPLYGTTREYDIKVPCKKNMGVN